MSSQHSSDALAGALLASKGAAAPCILISAYLEKLPTTVFSSPKCLSGLPSGTVPEVGATVMPAPALSRKDNGGTAQTREKLTIRLDQARHLRLKLNAAHLRRSSQAIMLDALDAYLSTIVPTTV